MDPSLFRIDCLSPYIQYNIPIDPDDVRFGWRGSSSGILDDGVYNNAFHMFTQARNASMSLDFYGTSIAFHGGMTSAQCQCAASADGGPSVPCTQGNSTFVELRDLSLGNHQVSLQVQCDRVQALDFLYATVDGWLGQPGTIPSTTRQFDDSNPNIVYGGPWFHTSHDAPARFVQGTRSQVNATQSTATFNFTGAAIALYGSLDSANGAYSVRLVNPKQTLNTNYVGTLDVSRNPTLLYFQGGLDPTVQNQIRITKQDDTSFLMFDAYTVYGAPSPKVEQVVPVGSKNQTTVIALATILAGLILSVLSGVALWALCRRKRRKDAERGADPHERQPLSPRPPIVQASRNQESSIPQFSSSLTVPPAMTIDTRFYGTSVSAEADSPPDYMSSGTRSPRRSNTLQTSASAGWTSTNGSFQPERPMPPLPSIAQNTPIQSWSARVVAETAEILHPTSSEFDCSWGVRQEARRTIKS